MSEKRFKLSKYVTPSSVSNFCDENGRMLNKEVVKVLNEQQATIEQKDKQIEEWEFSFRTEMAHHRVAEKELQDKIREQQTTISALKEEKEYFRKSRDKWKTIALQKDEQLKDCDNVCFNCRFYNKVCDFCTKFHIYTMTSGDLDE